MNNYVMTLHFENDIQELYFSSDLSLKSLKKEIIKNNWITFSDDYRFTTINFSNVLFFTIRKEDYIVSGSKQKLKWEIKNKVNFNKIDFNGKRFDDVKKTRDELNKKVDFFFNLRKAISKVEGGDSFD